MSTLTAEMLRSVQKLWPDHMSLSALYLSTLDIQLDSVVTG